MLPVALKVRMLSTSRLGMDGDETAVDVVTVGCPEAVATVVGLIYCLVYS